jgi:hypothetical protein
VFPAGTKTWMVVVVAIALILVAGLAIATQRPRHAEEDLGQPKLPPVTDQALNSFDTRAALKLVLQTALARRLTGTLQVTAGSRTCSLYFLFGHLFHAASDTLTGEAALLDCLTWQDVRYTFDAKSTMPTDETIERPIDQILAA